MKKKFLIDVNLPYYYSLWNTEEFIHQKDIDDEWTDEQIWNYAKERYKLVNVFKNHIEGIE